MVDEACSKVDPRETSEVALRAFFNIAKVWALSDQEQMTILGLDARPTLKEWKSGHVPHLPDHALKRISYVLGIFKAINILHPLPERANAWIRKPNSAPLFDGGSALDLMLGGHVSDLQIVRSYLDAERS
ncbi:MbcA/ParS/Xre antitoxin family protein [Sphingomicrobium sp. XHP0235]|uniref:MbcA/ParS/Xre antitoxin family protein n=1 Tax=Sphingomicrobium aquimarinum TaxID=3133971 RepID=UPI0031FEBA0B